MVASFGDRGKRFFIPAPLGVKLEGKIMTENIENQEQETVQPSAETKNTETHMIPKSRLDEEIKKRNDLQARLDALEKAQQDAEAKRLIEEKNFEELYNKSIAEINALKPKAERTEALSAAVEDALAAELANIPQDRLSLIPDELSSDAKLRYIARNRSLLAKSTPIDIGAGRQGGTSNGSVELTPEEMQYAKSFGYTPEEYAKYKK